MTDGSFGQLSGHVQELAIILEHRACLRYWPTILARCVHFTCLRCWPAMLPKCVYCACLRYWPAMLPRCVVKFSIITIYKNVFSHLLYSCLILKKLVLVKPKISDVFLVFSIDPDPSAMATNQVERAQVTYILSSNITITNSDFHFLFCFVLGSTRGDSSHTC